MLIVIEGPDGCGKTTTAKALAKKIDAEYMAFPAEGYDYKAIRAYLSEKWGVRCGFPCHSTFGLESVSELGALLFQALMTCNKYATLSRFRDAVGHSTHHIVLDRYWPSAWVYGSYDGLDQDWLRRIHDGLPTPDYAFLLKVDPGAALQRQTKRGESPERYEGDLDRAKKLSVLYQELWDYLYFMCGQTVYKEVPARSPPDCVLRKIEGSLGFERCWLAK
jgi:thymidylate kinase